MKYTNKIKAYSKDIIYQLLWRLGITSPNRYAKNKLTVITFHRVLTAEQRRQYPLPQLAVTPDELDRLCTEFKKYFECGSLASIHKRWFNNEKTDKPLLAITFDDGQLDNFSNAKPILSKHNLSATFYIPVQFINMQTSIWHDRLGFAIQACELIEGKLIELTKLCKKFNLVLKPKVSLVKAITAAAKDIAPIERAQFLSSIEVIANTEIPKWAKMMTWENISELQQCGHEIGSHSMTHPLLPQLSDSELSTEIVDSMNELEDKLQTKVFSFCYPNGDNNDNVKKVVLEAGYENAVSTEWGFNESTTDQYAIKRFDMDAFRLMDRNNRFSKHHLHARLSLLKKV